METVLVIDSIRKFKKYSQFKSLKDFNNNMEQWLVDHKKLFTPSELIALKRLIRFSAKVHGIANAKINTLLDAIKEKDTNGYGVSRDRKSTRLNSSHVKISYAVFCLKKKKKT